MSTCRSPSQRDSNIQCNERQGQLKPSENEVHSPSILHASESHRSMGEILSSMDQGQPQSAVGAESFVEKSMNRLTSPTQSVKRPTFWGRNTVSHSLLVNASLHFIPYNKYTVNVPFSFLCYCSPVNSLHG